jgi:hypothetical protein
VEDFEYLKATFEGSDIAHGRSIIVGKRDDGKLETKSWTEHRPIEDKDWIAHLEGKSGVGLSPITSQSKVKWGAIDVDEYKGKLDLSALVKDFNEAKLPLTVARSKSGGAHLFLFSEDWVPASLMIRALESISAYFGYAKCEIFPKQAIVTKQKGDGNCDYGNWLNLPYFGGINYLRYLHDDVGEAITCVKKLKIFVDSKRVTSEFLRDLKLTKKADEEALLFKDGPPCLERIYKNQDQNYRNVTLCNVAVYLKKKFNSEWKTHLDAFNTKFATPLPSQEVEIIKKSYDKKDYKYQCSKSPLCDFCNSGICRTKEFGVGEHNSLPSRRSLTKILSEPPLWYVDIQTEKGTKRISLETEELVNLRLFRIRCMEATNTLPSLMKQEDWDEAVHDLMEHVTEISAPKELTPEGELAELLQDFVTTNRSHDLEKASYEDILRGLVYGDVEGIHFRLRDLKKFLTQERYVVKQNKLAAMLKTTFKGQRSVKKILGGSVNCWSLDNKDFNKIVEELTTPDYESEQPY